MGRKGDRETRRGGERRGETSEGKESWKETKLVGPLRIWVKFWKERERMYVYIILFYEGPLLYSVFCDDGGGAVGWVAVLCAGVELDRPSQPEHVYADCDWIGRGVSV